MTKWPWPRAGTPFWTTVASSSTTTAGPSVAWITLADPEGNTVSVIEGKLVLKTKDGREIVLPDFIVELQKEIKTMGELRERIRTLERLLEGDLDVG